MFRDIIRRTQAPPESNWSGVGHTLILKLQCGHEVRRPESKVRGAQKRAWCKQCANLQMTLPHMSGGEK